MNHRQLNASKNRRCKTPSAMRRWHKQANAQKCTKHTHMDGRTVDIIYRLAARKY